MNCFARIAVLALTLSTLAGLNACSLVDVREEVSYDQRGYLLSQSLIEQMQKENTKAGWVLDHFGEPSVKIPREGDAETWIYRFEEQKYQRTRILFLFNYRTKKTIPREFQITIKDGMVHSLDTEVEELAAEPHERDV